MLDTATKRRIDTARDILVGKVPDPKSQVEQITIALIYKFMDDIDADSEELGGQRTFFAGDFARYGWPQLVRAGLGGHETLNLYAEAITRMPENPGIPPLFRDIFNNAYLPYRDPETLRAFLKVIDEFTYDHSERLGDAFEYLLSVLGSQGDAGQFRTPRHIIDFIVAVVDPKKDETVLDPACGTAGFLISSYKHILKANADDEGNSTLTPEEKGTLADNFKGYDISPDMVRLSLVNLYLHGFVDPRISEYDTLTSEERWNEYADVILANPPFMSPKGGIRPHRRFSVQSKRSEVLFVDYIAEHLTPAGRAGIIVPEGIIFQSQTAHKQLRKMLVESYLVAVVSLPAGVFQPYSGVKTSILLLDKALAQKTDRIAFFKVENDGFDLGAQRREIAENDLPQVREELGEYLERLRTGESVMTDGVAESRVGYTATLGLIAEKEKIAAGGEYNLCGERYRESQIISAAFPFFPIGQICTVNPRKSELSKFSADTEVSFVPMADLNENQIAFVAKEHRVLGEVGASYTYFADNDVLLAKVTPCFENGKAGIARNLKNGIGFGSSEFYVLRSSERVLPEWIYFCVTHPLFRQSGVNNMTGTGGLQRVRRNFIEDYEVPLPPLEVQRQIVAEIEGYQRVIDGARAVIDNYRPQIVVDPEWPMVAIGEVCNLINGRAFKPQDWKRADSGGLPIVRIQNLNALDSDFNYYTGEVKDRYIINQGQLLFSWSGSRGTSFGAHIWNGGKAILNQHIFKVEFDQIRTTKMYLFYALNRAVAEVEQNLHGGVGLVHITKGNLEKIQIPVPSLTTQQAIVAEIEAEQSLVDANRELVERMEGKIRAAMGRVWGVGDTVPAMTKVEND